MVVAALRAAGMITGEMILVVQPRGQKCRWCGGIGHFGGVFEGGKGQRCHMSQRSGAGGQRSGGRGGKDSAAISVIEVGVDAVDRQLGMCCVQRGVMH